MSQATNPKDVARAFKLSGCSWVLHMVDHTTLLQQAAHEIDEFIETCRARYGEVPDPFSLLEQNPSKGAAFFRIFVGVPITLDIRVLVWRLLLGASICSFSLQYRRGQQPQIRVELEEEHGRPFESHSLWDFQALRNLGVLAIDGTPILDGYYDAPALTP